MGATFSEAEALAVDLRAQFPYRIEVEEDCDNRGRYYLSVIADFGTEQELHEFLPSGWKFSGWRNREQRAWVAMIEMQ